MLNSVLDIFLTTATRRIVVLDYNQTVTKIYGTTHL